MNGGLMGLTEADPPQEYTGKSRSGLLRSPHPMVLPGWPEVEPTRGGSVLDVRSASPAWGVSRLENVTFPSL